MPKKFNVDWKADLYEGFAKDASSLINLCNERVITNGIKEVKGELERMLSSMSKGKAKDALSDVLNTMDEMRKFETGCGIFSALKNMTNKDFEYSSDIFYMADVIAIKGFLKKGGENFFSEKDKKLSPRDMREALDRFNLENGYSKYDGNEELFKKVDNIFNQFTKIQNMLIRIQVMQERSDTENRIKDHIRAREVEMKAAGKLLFENEKLDLLSIDDEIRTTEQLLKENEPLLTSADTEYGRKNMELLQAKKEKAELEAKKQEYTDNRSKAEQAMSEAEEKQQALNKDAALIEEAMFVKLPGLNELDRAIWADVPTSAEIMEKNCSAHVKEQSDFQHKHSDDAQKKNAEIQKLIGKNKALKDFSDQETVARQYRVYPELIQKVAEIITDLPDSYGINPGNMTVLQLQGVLEKKMKDDQRLAMLYELVSMAASFCPDSFKMMPFDSEYLEKLKNAREKHQAELASNESYIIALNIKQLMLQGQQLTDQMAALDKKDPYRIELEKILKDIKNQVNTFKKSGSYVKNSEKLLSLMDESENSIDEANKCRINILETYQLADNIEKQYQEKKEQNIAQKKDVIIKAVEKIGSKLPAGPEDMVKKIKKAIDNVKITNDVQEIQEAYDTIKNELEAMSKKNEEQVSKLDTAIASAKEEMIKWDYDSAIAKSEKKVSDSEKALKEEEKKLGEKEKIVLDSRGKLKDLKKVKGELTDLYNREKELRRFEADDNNGVKAKKEMMSGLFFEQIRTAFVYFSARKDHNKGSHKNTDDYKAMDDRLTDLLTIDPVNATAETYTNALTELKRSALSYIQAKNAQSFHLIPSKLRKYRLQYARSLMDICDSQMELIQNTDFAPMDPAIDKYISDLSAAQRTKTYTMEAFLSEMTEKKAAAIDMYKGSEEYKERDLVIPPEQPQILKKNEELNEQAAVPKFEEEKAKNKVTL